MKFVYESEKLNWGSGSKETTPEVMAGPTEAKLR